MADTFRILDLFSGIGGFSLGLERTGGFKTAAFCEIEHHRRLILEKHWPGVPCYHDVTKLTGDTLKRDGISVDVITGGFPCQDLSSSGTGEGLEGARSGLFYEIIRLIGEIRPRYVVLENSPNLIGGNDGRWAREVFGQLAKVGYDAQWRVIPASYFGAPHERKRVWIIAYPNGLRQSGPWQLIDAINPEADSFRQASGLINALQKDALPFLCGGHDGVPPRVDEPAISGLGNAVVPLIPELIGHAILASELHQQ
jgi:DNA (cytosine-5)-methyltransferase 1